MPERVTNEKKRPFFFIFQIDVSRWIFGVESSYLESNRREVWKAQKCTQFVKIRNWAVGRGVNPTLTDFESEIHWKSIRNTMEIPWEARWERWISTLCLCARVCLPLGNVLGSIPDGFWTVCPMITTNSVIEKSYLGHGVRPLGTQPLNRGAKTYGFPLIQQYIIISNLLSKFEGKSDLYPSKILICW